MSLDQEIKARRAEIHSDGYPMSIGELINLYRDDELDMHVKGGGKTYHCGGEKVYHRGNA